jgi:hypothetical protein
MNDDELLEQLGAAFAVEPLEPPHESVTALHRAVRAGTRSETHSSQRRRWLSAGLVGGVLSTGWAAAAAAYDDPLPGPIRSIAYEVGLPIDSRNLVDARNDRDGLRAALRRNDHAAIATQADELRRELRTLGSDERSAVQPEADQLLQQANDDHSSQNDHQDSGANQGQTGGSNSPNVSTAPGVDPVVTTTQGSDNGPNANQGNDQSQATDGNTDTSTSDPGNIDDGNVQN